MNFAAHFYALTRYCLRLLPLGAALVLTACAHQTPPPALHPQRPAKPAVSETQNRERARQALQKATVSSNEYSACVMFATSAHRNSDAPPDALAQAAAGSCTAKLDDYESSMAAYYEINPVKPVSAIAPRERAHGDRVLLEQKAREAVIQSLGKSD